MDFGEFGCKIGDGHPTGLRTKELTEKEVETYTDLMGARFQKRLVDLSAKAAEVEIVCRLDVDDGGDVWDRPGGATFC